MHEMSLMANLFDIIQDKAKEYNARRIISIRLKIGALAGVVPELLESAFEIYAKDTNAEGALFEIEKIPFKVVCRKCGETKIESDDFLWVCPTCLSTDLEVTSGDELIVENMEVEIDNETSSGI